MNINSQVEQISLNDLVEHISKDCDREKSIERHFALNENPMLY